MQKIEKVSSENLKRLFSYKNINVIETLFNISKKESEILILF